MSLVHVRTASKEFDLTASLQSELATMRKERDSLLALRKRQEFETHHLRNTVMHMMTWLENMTDPLFIEAHGGVSKAVAECYAHIQDERRACQDEMVRLLGPAPHPRRRKEKIGENQERTHPHMRD